MRLITSQEFSKPIIRITDTGDIKVFCKKEDVNKVIEYLKDGRKK